MKNYLLRHLQNFFGSLGSMSRQPVSTAMTVAVIGIALALPSALHIMVRNGTAVSGGWEHIRNFSVYLVPGTSLDYAQRLAGEIQQQQPVQSVTVISAEQAFEELQNSAGFGDVMNTLEDNPLPHTLVVQPTADAPPAALRQMEAELLTQKEVDLVKLDTDWVNRLNAGLDLVQRLVWIAAVLLIGAVIVITGNTIRLDIQNRRAEIEVSKLLGATDAFVRRPFLYIGFWYGLFGSCFALVLLGAGFLLLNGPAERLSSLYGGAFHLMGMDRSTAMAVFGGGLLAGLGGAWSAVARHLADIQPRV